LKEPVLKHSPSIYLLGSRLEKASDNHPPMRQNARMEKLDEALLMDMPSYSFLIVRCSTQLGTPRGRYDEHNSKSSLSYETKVYRTSRRKPKFRR
jgi:hypothetical protein